MYQWIYFPGKGANNFLQGIFDHCHSKVPHKSYTWHRACTCSIIPRGNRTGKLQRKEVG
ncbi:hypothetical protein PEX1_001730 [Penicillium expansum]|uniref:Uncharacterized protein n=1 Tax=Penicillium expansum TaxID=27334 RepID=A0A0A2IGL6_PENEN|nr:hypothetical protein PEX2_078910 [Penicillium expansum]KGO42242.1 hypothetical protein PEXP_051930 [Penicillium expansum]KGO55241.1 hypothetical protein PEX1_001730 [Penicillium expansum]KGO56284.1 hypothetical protein PEX2_078910 [Penicillium expansum]